MQIETTRYHYPPEWLKSERLATPQMGEAVDTRISYSGEHKMAHTGKGLAVSYETKHTYTYVITQQFHS